MKRLLLIIAAFALATSAWAAVTSLKVGDGTPENTLAAGDAYVTGDTEVDGVLLLDAIALVADDVTPDVAGGNIAVTGVNTVPTAITDLDNPIPGATYTLICGDIANASTIADGGNFTLNAAWNPTAVGDSILLYCRADNDYVELSRTFIAAGGGPVTGTIFFAGDGAVGAPSYTFLNDAGNDTGFYLIGPNIIGVTVGGVLVCTIDATGTTVVGGNGPWGTVTPDYGIFTDVTLTGDFSPGPGPEDLITNYSGRGTHVTFIETFTTGVDAIYAADWNVAGVVGAGTNTVTVRDGWSELVTGGAGGPDMESTVSFGLANYRAYEPRIESVVDLTALGGQRFEWGFYAAANEYVEIIYDTAVGNNWMLQVQDTVDTETIDSGVLVTVDPTKLEIQVDAAGTIHWAIDDVAMTEVGLTNLMTANAHYHRWMLTDIAAAVHTVAVDYFILEQLRQQ